MYSSKKFSLNKREAIKGVWLGVLGAIGGYLANLISAPGFNLFNAFNDWQTIVQGIITSGLLYLVYTFNSGKKK